MEVLADLFFFFYRIQEINLKYHTDKKHSEIFSSSEYVV